MSTQNSSISIDQLLQMALQRDDIQRNNGMNSLNNLADSNLSLFLQQLGGILSDESKPSEIRQLSAILIKNSLLKVDRYQEIWKTQLPQEQKKKN